MKAVTVQEAQSRLGELIAEAYRGELIILTDGEKQVASPERGRVSQSFGAVDAND